MQPTRRALLASLGTAGLGWAGLPGTAFSRSSPIAAVDDLPAAWKAEFPALDQQVNGQALAYLDSAATTERPRSVTAALARFDETDNANPGAALHTLARRAAQRYGDARARVARFLNAPDPSEVVFTKGTTEAINLVASAWGPAAIRSGDEIVLTIVEHYSNLLPWRALAERTGARIRIVDVDDQGRLNPERVQQALSERTRLIALSHVSNVLGLINPVADICALAGRRQVPVLVDAAQSAPHVRIDVQALGCDFLACSGHKMLGPMGVGVLWAKRHLLDGMAPYQLGSNMAHEVSATSARFEHGALRFQAGTPNVSGPVGLAAAIDFLERAGFEALQDHDRRLVIHARDRLSRIPGLRVLGSLDDLAMRLPVFTFTLTGVPVASIVEGLDQQGIAIRGGDMAALPLLARFGVSEAARASAYLYTTTADIDRLADALAVLARQGTPAPF